MTFSLRSWRELMADLGVSAPDRIADIPEADRARMLAAAAADPEFQRLTREIGRLQRRMAVNPWEMAQRRAACAWAEST